MRTISLANHPTRVNAKTRPRPVIHVASPPKALVVLWPDGAVEIYAKPGSLSVFVANALRLKDENLRAQADEILRAELPRAFAELFYPGLKIATGLLADCLTPGQRIEQIKRQKALELIKETGIPGDLALEVVSLAMEGVANVRG